MKVLVVVPALNEAASIEHVVTNLRALGYDVLVVSDGSTDDTAAIAKASGARVLHLVLNLGVGGALRAGFTYARDHGYDAAYQLEPPHYWHRYLIDRPIWQHCLLEAVILPPRSAKAGPAPILRP